MIYENLINLLDIFHLNRIIIYLNKYKINNIIDVGAHKGEFLSYCLKLNNLNKIFSFEPQKEIFNILEEKFKKIKKFLLTIML